MRHKNSQWKQSPTSNPWSQFIEYGNLAVIVDVDGKILWKLEKPEMNADGTWRNRGAIMTFCTKKEAVERAKWMGFPVNRVEQVKAPLGFLPWAIRYDFRYPHYLACW